MMGLPHCQSYRYTVGHPIWLSSMSMTDNAIVFPTISIWNTRSSISSDDKWSTCKVGRLAKGCGSPSENLKNCTSRE